MIDDLLGIIGVKAQIIVAGFAGGVTRIAFFGTGGAGPLAAVLAVIGGTASAAYLGPIGPAYLGWPENAKSTLATTFLVGLFGMEIVRQLGAGIRRWTPGIKKGNADAK